MKRKTTISDNPINTAVLIDPRSGKVIAKGSTPTEIINKRQAGGQTLSKAPRTKEDEIKDLEAQLKALKEN